MTLTAQTEAGATPPEPTPPTEPPTLGPVALARWSWRQLTSMRTALVLLFLLALAAVPGSVVPQEDIDAIAVQQWQADHPRLTPVYEFLGLFDVFGSAWFAAVYLLLMVSLVGCVVPRLRVYWRAMRAQPPRAPKHLSRMPEARRFEVDEDPALVVERATKALRGRRYRVSTTPDRPGEVAAEKGYLREAGNLLFHFSVIAVLVGFAWGQMFGFQGGVIVINGQGFSNSLSQYDDFAPGSLFEPGDLDPLSFTVDDFDVEFLTSGPQIGQPKSFEADITYRSTPGAEPRKHELAVNHPLDTSGTDVFLVGHGYAPSVTVRGGDGEVAYQGPVVFLPQDSSFASYGVIKVPDAGPDQLAFEGLFLPTYGFSMERGPFSQFPDSLDPVLSLVPYYGDLGLDDGESQSVYQLDKDDLSTFESDDASLGAQRRIKLSPGDTAALPGDRGSITFDGVRRFVRVQVSDTPGEAVALGGVLLGIVGLMGSLFVRPRRAWVRVASAEGTAEPRRTVVEVAGLDRSSGGDLTAEVDELERLVRGDTGPDEGKST